MWRYLFQHNSNSNCPIIIIFGTVVTASWQCVLHERSLVTAQGWWVESTLFHLHLEGVLYLLTGCWPTLHCGRLPTASCPQNTCFGRRLSGIRMTWPVHRIAVLLARMARYLWYHNYAVLQCWWPCLAIFNTGYLAEAAKVELVHPADWSSIECPGLTAVKQCRQNYGLVYINLCFHGHVMHAPQPPLEFTKCTACLDQTRCYAAVAIHRDNNCTRSGQGSTTCQQTWRTSRRQRFRLTLSDLVGTTGTLPLHRQTKLIYLVTHRQTEFLCGINWHAYNSVKI